MYIYIQTHKRFEKKNAIMVKHNMGVFRVSPFFKLQNNT